MRPLFLRRKPNREYKMGERLDREINRKNKYTNEREIKLAKDRQKKK